MVLRKVTWPHKLVYSTRGQPPAYEELSVPLFLSGYLAIICATKLTQKPLMIKKSDGADGRCRVIWLLENSLVSWVT